MVVDDALLMAYVDGELSPQQCQELERLMDASPDLAERVSHLMASCLPYDQAFARQSLPPVPESLVHKIEALTGQRAAAGAANPSQAFKAQPVPGADSFFTRVFGQGRPKFAWMITTFAAGAVCYGLVAESGIVTVLLHGETELRGPTVVQASPWVRQAANYQQLYTRDTVSYITPDSEVVKKTLADIRSEDDLSLRIPDLTSVGLTFKRVQRLRFNDKALIQLVYLPANGAPVALCVMKELMPDQSTAQQQVSGMNVVTWRQSELGYALIGEPKGVDLNAVARLVANRSTGQLFAGSPAPLWIAALQQ
ncbi:anti-sigma factor family protein [Pseudomonas gingeri]